MPIVSKSVATLRFGGDDLDPDEISEVLGKNPTLGVRKGSVWLTPKGSEVVANSGRWHLRTDEARPADVDQHIAALFSGLTDNLPKWRSLAERYSGNVFVGLFLGRYNEGLSLSAPTLSAIGARGLELDLDIYSDDNQASDAEVTTAG